MLFRLNGVGMFDGDGISHTKKKKYDLGLLQRCQPFQYTFREDWLENQGGFYQMCTIQWE